MYIHEYQYESTISRVRGHISYCYVHNSILSLVDMAKIYLRYEDREILFHILVRIWQKFIYATILEYLSTCSLVE